MSKTKSKTISKTKSSRTNASKNKQEGVPFDRWFVEVVVLSLVPTISVLTLQLIANQKICFWDLLGNGDLLLSASIISTSSILHLYWNSHNNNSKKLVFYLSLFCNFFCLLIYAGIKIGKTSQIQMAPISIVFILCAFVSSYAAER